MLLCAIFGFSCHQEAKEISPELAMIDSIMWDHPDSALTLLEKMPKPSPSDKLNDATWCLLYTQACDKNYKKHTSDSLINIALRYFDPRVDGRRKAQAWFYKGAVCRDLSRLEEATACYVRARDLIGSFDDPLFASLICQTLGRVYREQKVYDQALELFREAIYYVARVPRRDDWSHAYSELGRTFAECEQLDSARYYFERSLENGVLIDDLKMQAMAIGELGTIYRLEKNYTKALECKKEDLALTLKLGDTINSSTVRLGIASVFYQMGELDSAEVYFKKSLNTSNMGRIRTVNLALYFIAKKQLRYDDAFTYIEQYRHYNDSINNIDRTRAIAEAQEKYDNEKLENEKKTLLLEKDRLQKSILWGGIITVVLLGLIAFGYQRKLWLKERNLRKSEEEIQEYLSNLHENEEKIRENQDLIESLSKDQEDKKNLINDLWVNVQFLKAENQEHQYEINEYTQLAKQNEEKIRENQDLIESLSKDQEDKKIQINDLKDNVQFLVSKNRKYQSKIDEYIQMAKQNDDRVIKLEKLSGQNLYLKGREAFLIDYINKHVDFFKKLRENPRQPIDWTLLFENLNVLHNNFYSRLRGEFPSLTEMDIQVCCLIKAGLTTSQIADVFCISGPSVTKKKSRIRERINQSKEGSLDAKITLDVFLINY